MSFHQQIEDKIVSCGQLTALLDERRKEADGHCKAVFTNGCFDLVHLGHVDYLSRARDLGNLLIVGLNSDDSVRRLKGDSRPVSHQNSRAHVLASFAFVDYVVIFDEDTPLRLIQSLRPDILVKGGDYTVDQVVGADFVQSYGGEVVLIDLVEGESSTRLVEKMRGEKI